MSSTLTFSGFLFYNNHHKLYLLFFPLSFFYTHFIFTSTFFFFSLQFLYIFTVPTPTAVTCRMQTIYRICSPFLGLSDIVFILVTDFFLLFFSFYSQRPTLPDGPLSTVGLKQLSERANVEVHRGGRRRGGGCVVPPRARYQIKLIKGRNGREK